LGWDFDQLLEKSPAEIEQIIADRLRAPPGIP
jgi:hypothetical protein